MQQLLRTVGMLDDSLVGLGYFCEFTHTALQEFQANRGLPKMVFAIAIHGMH